jgi:hypothetical protein
MVNAQIALPGLQHRTEVRSVNNAIRVKLLLPEPQLAISALWVVLPALGKANAKSALKAQSHRRKVGFAQTAQQEHIHLNWEMSV